MSDERQVTVSYEVETRLRDLQRAMMANALDDLLSQCALARKS